MPIVQLNSILDDLIQFSILSIGTAKKIMGEVRTERPGLSRFRIDPTKTRGSGLPPAGGYVTPLTDKKELIEARKATGLDIKPHSFLSVRNPIRVVRDMPDMSALPGLPAVTKRALKNSQSLFRDPLATAVHEHGHMSVPPEVDTAMKKLGRLTKKNYAEQSKLRTGEEYRANRDILERIKKHGTLQEAEKWRELAQTQTKYGYRNQFFHGLANLEATKAEKTKARTLDLGRRVVSKYPWLRRQELSSRIGSIRFNQGHAFHLLGLLDDLIQFRAVTWEDNPLYPEDIKSSVQKVPIKHIVSHQDAVKKHIVEKYKKKPGRDLPMLHKIGSKYYVEDGNHRIVAKMEKGEKTVRARVFEKELSAKLDDLIEFKLYQPSPEDQPPATLPQFKHGQIVDYVEQEHHAKRAGKHTDLRIGNRRGMFSWATKKDLPEPGSKIQLHPQPIHPQSYNRFVGEIPSGYGAGTVQPKHIGKALVTRSDPDQTNITVGTKRGSHRLAILNTRLGHLLVREKHPESPTAPKPAYKSLRGSEAPEYLRTLPPGSVVQPKIDGALVHVKSHQGKLEIFSHRKNKEGNPILHTERFFKGRPKIDLEGETITGELYGTRKGKAIEPQELGGILNAHLSKSLEKQKQQNVKLKIMPFDLQDRGTYPERLNKLKELVSRKLPKDKFTLPEEAHTPEVALDLHERIRAGRHPLTSEGIIIHPPTGKMIKVKNTEEANVKITGTFPGTGKFGGSHGGFTYEGGRVGTGFTDEARRELHKHIGRTARIRHQGQYKTGAYRAPSFIAIDESR